jgi:hypothetical protein
METFAKNDRSCFIQPSKTAKRLAQIGTQNLDFRQMRRSLPMPAMIAAVSRKGGSPHQAAGAEKIQASGCIEADGATAPAPPRQRRATETQNSPDQSRS